MSDRSFAEQGVGNEGQKDNRSQFVQALDEYVAAYPGKQSSDPVRVQETRTYLQSPAVLEQFASLYQGIGEPQDTHRRNAVQAHARVLMEHLFDQDIANPEQYASHGVDHSLRAMGYMRELLDNTPALVSVIGKKYGISHVEARFMMESLALVHDIGYANIAGKNKAAHSLLGADTLASATIQDAYRNILTSPSAQKDALLHDFRDAVLFHNADKVEHEFDAKVRTTKGEFLADMPYLVDVLSTFTQDQHHGTVEVVVATDQDREALQAAIAEVKSAVVIRVGQSEGKFKGRKIDLHTKDDKRLGLEVQDMDLEQHPFQAAIRIVDNMDITKHRLNPLQQEPAFREIYHAFGDGGPLSVTLQHLEEMRAQLRQAIAGEADETVAYERMRQASLQARDTILLQVRRSGKEIAQQLFDRMTPEKAELVWKNMIIKDVFAQPVYQSLDAKKKERIAEVTIQQDSKEIRHFGGCEAIEAVTFSGKTVQVVVDTPLYTALNAIRCTESIINENGTRSPQEMGIGEYQLWRMKEAFAHIRVGGKPIMIEVVGKDGQHIAFDEHAEQSTQSVAA